MAMVDEPNASAYRLTRTSRTAVTHATAIKSAGGV
jgi:hypothetical protein